MEDAAVLMLRAGLLGSEGQGSRFKKTNLRAGRGGSGLSLGHMGQVTEPVHGPKQARLQNPLRTYSPKP